MTASSPPDGLQVVPSGQPLPRQVDSHRWKRRAAGIPKVPGHAVQPLRHPRRRRPTSPANRATSHPASSLLESRAPGSTSSCGTGRGPTRSRLSSGAGAARPVPVFLLPFDGVKRRARVWLTNSGIEAQPMLSRRVKLAMSVLDEETPGSALVTLSVPADSTARNVVGAIGEPEWPIDFLLQGATAVLLDVASTGSSGRSLEKDGWHSRTARGARRSLRRGSNPIQSAQSAFSSNSMSTNGSTRTTSASMCVATIVQWPLSSRSTSSGRASGSMSHAWLTPSCA